MKIAICFIAAVFSASAVADIKIENQYGQFSTRPDARQSLNLGPYQFSRSPSGAINVGTTFFGQPLSITTQNGRAEFQLNGDNIQVSPYHGTITLFGSEITLSK